jgi:hypothetical protein
MAIERLHKLGGKGDIQEAHSIIQEGLNEEEEEGDEDGDDEGKATANVLAALESSPSEILPKHPSLSLTARVGSTSSESLRATQTTRPEETAEGTPPLAEEKEGEGEGEGEGKPITTEAEVGVAETGALASETDGQENQVQVEEVSVSVSAEA